MKLHVIETGMFKLDGGAMYGVVPKPLWQHKNPADAKNKCSWAMRSLLIETDDRKILIDTGMGDKQDEKFMSIFEPSGTTLHRSLAEKGFMPEDITDVFLTHLHFDHVGGAVEKGDSGLLEATFPNATYWSTPDHWAWAMDPNPRERASFLKENFVPLEEEGVVQMIETGSANWIEGIDLEFLYGHTEAMMAPVIQVGDRKVLYCADLMPSASHVPLAWVMGYDLRPLKTIEEKERILSKAVEENHILFFEHDPVNECATVKRNERGRIVVDQTMSLEEALTSAS